MRSPEEGPRGRARAAPVEAFLMRGVEPEKRVESAPVVGVVKAVERERGMESGKPTECVHKEGVA